MAVICGGDGCKGGWVAVMEDIDSCDISWRVVPSLRDLATSKSPPKIITLDVPIGLPDKGSRACDLEARQLLGRGRMSSVFPAPIRPVLQASSHAEASAVGAAVDGRRLSIQAWAIIPKIREVHEILRGETDLRTRVREVHPEVCFYFMAGKRPMQFSKRRRAGRDERRCLLSAEFGDVVDDALGDRRSLGCAADDLLDAFAALWTARRIVKGTAITLPALPPRDRHGLRLEMVA